MCSIRHISPVLLSILLLVISVCCTPNINSQQGSPEEASKIEAEYQSDKVDSISLLFLGDIICYKSQVRSAYDTSTNKHNFKDVFEKVRPILQKADYTIANLEVTLSGEPYTGYPRFSSPDELAMACRMSGINVLTTANNHSCDYDKEGLLRTINILDSLEIKHTGSFKNLVDMRRNNLLVLEKDDIRLGLLTYTYGTNGNPVPKPTIVNIIDTLRILSDIERCGIANLDKLIVSVHWGLEYQSQPSSSQVELAGFLFRNGVDIIIGSHPHVLQRMEFIEADSSGAERLIAYSLGNFISNQRKRKTDGGAILKVSLVKSNNECQISDVGYYLTWVNKPYIDGRVKFEVLPCSFQNNGSDSIISTQSKKKMNVFLSDSRALLGKENIRVEEIRANPDSLLQ